MRLIFVLTLLAVVTLSGDLLVVDLRGLEFADGEVDVEEMLYDFVDDFCSDRQARPLVFGIEVRDADPSRYHVVVEELGDDSGRHEVLLEPSFPDEPIPYYTTDVATLRRIHRGELACLTAMSKTFSTDFAPLDLKKTQGFEPDAELSDYLIIHAFHFWTRGFPERVQFGSKDRSRSGHGANATLFYYQKGFRSGFFSIEPGQRVNEDERSQTNPFPTLIILNNGQVQAKIGETRCELQAGEAIYIGPDVHHEFWVSEEAAECAEGFLVMFGEGA